MLASTVIQVTHSALDLEVNSVGSTCRGESRIQCYLLVSIIDHQPFFTYVSLTVQDVSKPSMFVYTYFGFVFRVERIGLTWFGGIPRRSGVHLLNMAVVMIGPFFT